jgi:ribokinase
MSAGQRIVVVGSINLDLVAGAARIPAPGETVSGSSFQTFFGGKGANQAVAAGRLGASVHMLGKVGNDVFGPQLRTGLEAAGVNTAAVQAVSGASGVALIATDSAGQNSIIVVPGANGEVTPADLDSHVDSIRGAAIVLTQLEIPLATVEHLASITQRERVPLMLDPAPARALPDTLFRSLDWITPNETETCILLGKSSLDWKDSTMKDSAEALLKRGVSNVILKLGERGCYLALANGHREFIPAYKVRAVDTTAAGDAFNGAFATALVRGKDPVRAAEWASAVAAISVTRAGAQPSMPSQAEVDNFLAQNPRDPGNKKPPSLSS